MMRANLIKIIKKLRLKLASIEKRLSKQDYVEKATIINNNKGKIYVSKNKLVEIRKYFASLSGAVKSEDIIKNFEDWSEHSVYEALKKLVSTGEIIRIKRGIYRRNLG